MNTPVRGADRSFERLFRGLVGADHLEDRGKIGRLWCAGNGAGIRASTGRFSSKGRKWLFWAFSAGI